MILNHFKIKKEFLEKHKKAIISDPGGFVSCNKEVTLSIENSALIPSWSEKESLIKIPGYYQKKYSRRDVSLNSFPAHKEYGEEKGRKEEYNCFLDLSKPINIKKFDTTINYLTHERYIQHKAPFFTKFPIPYYIVPVRIRNTMINLIKGRKEVPRFPSWPAEKSVETLRHVFLKALEIKTGKKVPCAEFWPAGKKCCFIATHDLETQTSFKNIDLIREIEKQHGIRSSWNVLSKRYKINFNKLRQLKKDGCEIGIHGYNHDGKLPYLGKEKAIKRITSCKKALQEFRCSSFRSPQLQRNEEFLELLSNYFKCDSSVPDTDIKGAAALKSGCCTVFPYMINNMVEIPITLAQDFRLIYTLGLKEKEMLEHWKNKVDYIHEVGGVINILTHPDDYLIGNEKYLRVYERLLEHIAKKKETYHNTISNVAELWKDRQSKTY